MADKTRKIGKKMITAVLLITVLAVAPASWADASEGETDNVNFIMLYDSEGEVLHAGTAVALNMKDNSPAYIVSDIFDEEAASAYLVTNSDVYEIEYDSSGSNISAWLTKDPCPADDPEFLKMADAHQGDRAAVCYYSLKSGELELCRETVVLTECDENSWYTADHYPEAVVYPAVLVNEDNECVGILEADGVISGITDQDAFYESSMSAEGDTSGNPGNGPGFKTPVRPEDAVYPVYIQDNENAENVKVINTSAVSCGEYTYLFTSVDAVKEYDYSTRFCQFFPEDFPDGMNVRIQVIPVGLTDEGVLEVEPDAYLRNGSQIAVVIGIKEKAPGTLDCFPVAERINPSHQLGCVFTYLKVDAEKNEINNLTYGHYIMDYSHIRDNLYSIDEDIGFEDSIFGGWSGALIYDMVTHEAVGIGTYADGEYAFEDITAVMRNLAESDQDTMKNFSAEEWGSFYAEIQANDNN